MPKPQDKLIAISKHSLKGINILAAMSGTDAKNYIQDLVTKHVSDAEEAGEIVIPE